MKNLFTTSIKILVAILLMACSSQYDKKLEQALERAKENRQELEKVLDHYKKDSTSCRPFPDRKYALSFHTGTILYFLRKRKI